MGKDAESVLTSTSISDTDEEKLQPIVSKPVKFFKVQKNTIYERARFSPRDQREDESIKQCIIALYELKRCADMIAQKRQHSYPAVMGWLRYWL